MRYALLYTSELILFAQIAKPEAAKVEADQEFTFSRIGGLDAEITAIREILDTSLLNPERLERYGLKPSRGLLLYGPPGTGKTLIAKTISEELNVNFVVINGPEILSGLVGESESKVGIVFPSPRNNTLSCVLFSRKQSRNSHLLYLLTRSTRSVQNVKMYALFF